VGAYSVPMGYLRAFITLLVVAHHAVLAYHPFAPPMAPSLLAEPRWWPVFPIVDEQRWAGFMLLTAFNDMFFMSLMFFLSGVFVWGSLQRKQAAAFLRDRAMRLGVPFVVSMALLAPLAYYPSYLASAGSAAAAGGFRAEWLSLGMWPAGPAWSWRCFSRLTQRRSVHSGSCRDCRMRLPARSSVTVTGPR
jgi:Acyltransferase family